MSEGTGQLQLQLESCGPSGGPWRVTRVCLPEMKGTEEPSQKSTHWPESWCEAAGSIICTVRSHRKACRLEAYGCCSPSAWESLVQHGHAFYTDEITLLWFRASNFGPISVFCFLRFCRFHQQWYFRDKDQWIQCGLLESYLVDTGEWNSVDTGQQDTVSTLICQSVDPCSWVRGFLFMMFQGGLLLVH